MSGLAHALCLWGRARGDTPMEVDQGMSDRTAAGRRPAWLLAAGAAVLAVTMALAGWAAAEDVRDVRIVNRTLARTLEKQRSGVPVRWSNPASGHSGEIVVTRTFFQGDGTPCRDYKRTTRAGRTVTVVRGTGCRTGPGRWSRDERVVSVEPSKTPLEGKRATAPGEERKEAATVPAFRPPRPLPKPLVITASLPNKSEE